MKLIIWWCSLMVILPFLYLFWWKKRWRLLFGIIILAVLVISYWAPGEIAHSILTTETEKEKPFQKLEMTLRGISDDEPKSSDSEKLKMEKGIIKLKKEVEKGIEKMRRGELSEKEISELQEKNNDLDLNKWRWVKKWGKKENSPTLLFCGKEFNEQLTRERKSGNRGERVVENYNIIDFGKRENNKAEAFKKKIQEICKQEENHLEKFAGKSPIIWLKNIDKITDSELKNELLKVVDPNQNTNLGKYQIERKPLGKKEEIIDLSQFTLVATTSTTNPKLSKELRTKLKHIEPFLDKYFWVIFFTFGVLEIIVFLLLIRSKRKSKNKSLKRFEY